jgi:hypothetical protein
MTFAFVAIGDVVECVRIAVKTQSSGGNASTLSSLPLHDNHARPHDADSFSAHCDASTPRCIAGPRSGSGEAGLAGLRRDAAGFLPHLGPVRELTGTASRYHVGLSEIIL